jgi:hypothetical protein
LSHSSTQRVDFDPQTLGERLGGFLNMSIVPRPIDLVSTRSSAGDDHLTKEASHA